VHSLHYTSTSHYTAYKHTLYYTPLTSTHTVPAPSDPLLRVRAACSAYMVASRTKAARSAPEKPCVRERECVCVCEVCVCVCACSEQGRGDEQRCVNSWVDMNNTNTHTHTYTHTHAHTHIQTHTHTHTHTQIHTYTHAYLRLFSDAFHVCELGQGHFGGVNLEDRESV
jgi:hypothetical protein